MLVFVVVNAVDVEVVPPDARICADTRRCLITTSLSGSFKLSRYVTQSGFPVFGKKKSPPR